MTAGTPYKKRKPKGRASSASDYTYKQMLDASGAAGKAPSERYCPVQALALWGCENGPAPFPGRMSYKPLNQV